MTSIRRLASALCLALCFSQYSNAQTVDPVTGNVVYTTVNPPPDGWTNHTWTGFENTTSNGGGFSGGHVPGYNPSTGTFMFGYNEGTVSYSTPINAAFANSGPGVLVSGFTYSWNYYNQQDYRGTLSGNINLTSNTGSVLHSYNYSMPQTTTGWTNMSGVQNFGAQYSPLSLGNLNVSFTGKDDRWWAGYYGPQIKDIDVRLNYTVDPCVANPLYSSTCPGFNDIVLSGNLVPNPSAVATWGQGLNQTFNIATALQHGGLGVKVHGFQWGYNVFVGNPYCAGFLCSDWRDPDVTTNVNIRDSAGNSIYSITRKGEYDDKEYWSSYNYSYQLPSSLNSLTLGNFEFTAQTSDYAGIYNMYARIQYTPDQCVLNPLFSVSCTGYQQAYFDQQCTANPLYSNQCPGYAQAYYDQQCTISSLYDSGCPGYAQAYFTQQCTLNPLYNQSCPGYAQAYFNQQCQADALYNAQCPGYAQAKVLKDMQEQRTETADAETSGTVVIAAAPSTNTLASPTSSTVLLADPTKTETVVTTDVGGVELTTTGEISIPTGETSSTKEAVKEAAIAEEKKVEEKKIEGRKETEKKRVDPRALAIARGAARDAERTALSVSESAVTFSQSDMATSAALGLGTGITLQGYRPPGVTDDNSDNKEVSVNQNRQQNNINTQTQSASMSQSQDTAQKSGPSVRNGGSIDGMNGGDFNSLAQAPADFNSYLNSQIRDSQFYTSKEIYKGQRNVDNARALRGLGTDRLHQEMVDQQYGK